MEVRGTVSGTNIVAPTGTFANSLTVSGVPVNLTAGGATDHGALTGLLDDDHAQYVLVNGTRAFTGNQSMGGNDLTNVDFITPVVNQVLTISGHGNKITSSGIDGTVIEAMGLGGMSLFSRGFGELLLESSINITANAGGDLDLGADSASRFAWLHADGNYGITYITADGPSGSVSITAAGAGGGIFIEALGAVIGQVQVNATSLYSATVGGTTVFNASTGSLTTAVPLRATAGTAAAPQYSFTGDTDTGYERAAANVLGLSAGATFRLTVSGANATTSGIGVAGNVTANRGNFGAQLTASGLLAAGNGSVTAPAISFASDPDNGLYRVSANRIAIAAGGSQAIDCNGTTVNFPGFIRAADGSAASPTWGFTNDGDVGGFRVGTNTMALSAGGTARLTISGADAVTSGIGVDGNITATRNILVNSGTFTAGITVGGGGATTYIYPDEIRSARGIFTGLVDALNDAAAASAGVPVAGLYHNSGIVKIRLV